MKKFILSVLLISMVLFCGCSNSIRKFDSDSNISAENMTLEEKVGQIFMVRCDSVTADEIAEKKPGGIIMFASDFSDLTESQVISKISYLKSSVEITPFIAVDEEGGTVVRVSQNPNLVPRKYKSPQEYYNEGGIELIKNNAKEKSELLLKLGINMNLSPVADISTNADDFIYDRSFGKGAEETADYVSEVVSVMNECNIASCLKHFPGYGGNVDTHTSVAVDTRSLAYLEENDFLPFQSGIAAGADSVLVSHNIINDIDSSQPATLSRAVHEILRNDLQFSGLIITDDMSMAAAADYSEPYKRAVLAGNDMIIVTDFDTAYNEVLSAAENGEISVEIIDTAVNRIISAKRHRGLLN